MSRLVLLTLLCAVLVCRADTILVNDQFSDLERLTDDVPNSLRWTYGAHHGTAASAFTSLDASSGALVWDHTQSAGVNSFSAIWGHFTPAASPFTLGIGEKLTLSLEVSFAGGSFITNANAFRWALFDSNNSRITSDFAGANATGISSGSIFSPWRGYAAQTTVSSTEVASSNFLTRERTGSGTGLFTSSEYIDVPGSAVDELEFTTATTYTLTLELNRTVAGMEVRGSVNGTFTAFALDAAPVVEFDTISVFTLDGLSHNITVDNVQLTHIVPEPSAGLLLGAGLLGLARRARRR
jgi:hypothetical protein